MRPCLRSYPQPAGARARELHREGRQAHPHALQTATNVGAGYNGQRVTPVMGHVIVVNERQAGGGGGSGSAPK